MSVVIQGMEMPKSCDECDLNYDCFRCILPIENSLLYGKDTANGRLPNCPLVELPPHGRLIDADALVADLKGQVERLFNLDAVSESDFFIERNEKFRQAMWKNWCESFYEYLSTRPTIIEAEGVSE